MHTSPSQNSSRVKASLPLTQRAKFVKSANTPFQPEGKSLDIVEELEAVELSDDEENQRAEKPIMMISKDSQRETRPNLNVPRWTVVSVGPTGYHNGVERLTRKISLKALTKVNQTVMISWLPYSKTKSKTRSA